jgi:hypothetical protein
MRSVDLGDLRLHARADSVPRSLLVYDASVADDQSALTRMGSPEFDPNQDVVLSPHEASVARQSTRPGQAVEPSLQRADRWQAHVSLPEPGYLLQREAWYPGWRARVDGVDAPVLRADLLFRAIPLSAGEHDVEVYFESASFGRGVLVSIVVLAVIGLLVIWRR